MSKVNHEEERIQQAHARARALARRQGVGPIHNMDDLPRDPAPEEDSVDEFLAWIAAIRRQDKDRSSLE